jgi:hypothetical protein
MFSSLWEDRLELCGICSGGGSCCRHFGIDFVNGYLTLIIFG